MAKAAKNKGGLAVVDREDAPAPKRKHESPALLIEALTEVQPKIRAYFTKSTKAGVLAQDALADVRALLDLADVSETFAKELKELIAAHKKAGGEFEPGKMIVKITNADVVTIPWKEQWQKTRAELAAARGESVNLEKEEAKLKLSYDAKSRTTVQIIVGD